MCPARPNAGGKLKQRLNVRNLRGGVIPARPAPVKRAFQRGTSRHFGQFLRHFSCAPRSPLPPRQKQHLFVLEGGFALVDEGSHTLFLVFQREERMEQAALEADAFCQGCFVGAVNGFLRERGDRA